MGGMIVEVTLEATLEGVEVGKAGVLRLVFVEEIVGREDWWSGKRQCGRDGLKEKAKRCEGEGTMCGAVGWS